LRLRLIDFKSLNSRLESDKEETCSLFVEGYHLLHHPQHWSESARKSERDKESEKREKERERERKREK
jgi:hypothetical protein